MTLRTQGPSAFMFATINTEVLGVMIEGRRNPSRHGMARFTVRREFCSQMRWIGCLVVVWNMASGTQFCRSNISGGMTFDTIHPKVSSG